MNFAAQICSASPPSNSNSLRPGRDALCDNCTMMNSLSLTLRVRIISIIACTIYPLVTCVGVAAAFTCAILTQHLPRFGRTMHFRLTIFRPRRVERRTVCTEAKHNYAQIKFDSIARARNGRARFSPHCSAPKIKPNLFAKYVARTHAPNQTRAPLKGADRAAVSSSLYFHPNIGRVNTINSRCRCRATALGAQ